MKSFPHDLEVIVSLLEVASILLTTNKDSVFSFEELFNQAKELSGDDFVLEEADVRIVLPGMKYIKNISKNNFKLV